MSSRVKDKVERFKCPIQFFFTVPLSSARLSFTKNNRYTFQLLWSLCERLTFDNSALSKSLTRSRTCSSDLDRCYLGERINGAYRGIGSPNTNRSLQQKPHLPEVRTDNRMCRQSLLMQPPFLHIIISQCLSANTFTYRVIYFCSGDSRVLWHIEGTIPATKTPLTLPLLYIGEEHGIKKKARDN